MVVASRSGAWAAGDFFGANLPFSTVQVLTPAHLAATAMWKLNGLCGESELHLGVGVLGMPGFSGVPAELTILIGTWRTSPLWATFATAGVLVAAAFTLRAIQVSFFGTTDRSTIQTSAPHAPYEPITWPERIGAILLVGATVYVGLKPDVLLNWIAPALESPLMQAALKGGAS